MLQTPQLEQVSSAFFRLQTKPTCPFPYPLPLLQGHTSHIFKKYILLLLFFNSEFGFGPFVLHTKFRDLLFFVQDIPET